MIITKLKGGLGNQMFQYAAARGTVCNVKYLRLDLSFFTDKAILSQILTPRKYELGVFNSIKAQPASYVQSYALNNDNLQAKALRKLLFSNLKIVKQVENEFIKDINHVDGDLFLDGYFQSHNYFSHVRSYLLDDFAFPVLGKKNLDLKNKIDTQKNSVCVHVRRGDYLIPEVLKYHGIVTLEYYSRAIKQINGQLTDPHFFVFSDDSEWCKQNLEFGNSAFTLVEGNTKDNSWKDMCLMAECRHHIIANSSFSWWGAWLSQKQGLKFAPYKWFNPEVAKFNITDLIPETWQIIYYD